uniref:long-chain-fatty-acid--CoA ligase n=1 Tax=Acrobeloides nanus TaxID=290746 RepID=A0A914DF01_9BILA
MKVFFMVYDAIVWLPFKIFADPENRKQLSDKVKAKPTKDGDPSSPWRHVEVIDKPLQDLIFSNCPTLGEMWDEAVDRYSDSLCMGRRGVKEVFEEVQKDGRKFQKLILGDYEWIDYAEADEQIASIAQALKILGLKKGTHIVIYAETRMEWLQTAIACFKNGLPVVTVYATLGEEAVAYAMKECDAVAVFTTFGLLEKVNAAVKDCPSIVHVIYYPDLHQRSDEPQKADASLEKLFTDIDRNLYDFETLLDMGESGEETTTEVKPDDLAMIMYTSGTTGNPKGVMLSHKNIIAALAGQSAVIPVNENDIYIGYLPLAHILEVCAEIVCLSKGCRIGYSSAQTLHDRAPKIQKGSKGDCRALKPTLIACVPAVLDRIFKAITDEVRQASPVFREIFRICYERTRSRYKEGYKSLLMKKLAFNRICKLLGGNIHCMLCGGAPLNNDTQRFMNVVFCTPVVQGYGLTETCGGATLAEVYDLSTGSVGPPLRCCEIMLRQWDEAGYSPKNDPPQGEVLIHGSNIALGYYKNEEKTREDFITINGKRWFASGDIGEFRADGSLRIIDRKKDLIKLSHGEYVSLARVETTLLTNPNIDNICVYGNSNRDYLIALVVPNQKNLEQLADKNGIKHTSFEELCKDDRVSQLVTKTIKDHVTGKLQRVEIPQKIHLCHEPWTPASGLLTEAMKLKRKTIEKEFEKEINALYKEK